MPALTEEKVRDLIQEERRRQDARWGGPAHDDTHIPEEWRAFITEHTTKLLNRCALPTGQQRAIEVAALGFAVTDVLERYWRGRVPCEHCKELRADLRAVDEGARALEQAADAVLSQYLHPNRWQDGAATERAALQALAAAVIALREARGEEGG